MGMLGFAINQWRVSTKSAAMLAEQHAQLKQIVEMMSENLKEMKTYLYQKAEKIDANRQEIDSNKQDIALLIAAQTRCTNDVASAHRQLETMNGKHHDLEKFIYSHVAEGQQR